MGEMSVARPDQATFAPPRVSTLKRHLNRHTYSTCLIVVKRRFINELNEAIAFVMRFKLIKLQARNRVLMGGWQVIPVCGEAWRK